MKTSWIGIVALILYCFSFFKSYAQEAPPNIVLIVADDLGYGDLQSYGAEDIKTPNIDQLAEEGVKFTNFYANGPQCTPTRAALLTGRYQQRVGGLESAIGLGNVGRYEEARKLSDQGLLGLPTEFNVLPSILNDEGYNTALIGKWHLGSGDNFRPDDHGFDYSIGPTGGAVDYFHHTEPEGYYIGAEMEGKHDMYRNDKPHHREGYYMTHLITDEAVEWLNIQNLENPFFLYLPYTAPHNPMQSPNDYQDENLTTDSWGEGNRSDFIPLVEELDKGIGQILEKLEQKGFAENTLVIFFSDNGASKKGSNGVFSGYKGEVFEGGIRVPCIIKWPGKIPQGIISDQISISMDLTASIASVVEASPPKPLDGINLVGHIIDDKKNYSRTLFWRIKRGGYVRKAVRDGNLKYIHNFEDGKTSEYLFNLASDPGEQDNLMDQKTKQLGRLKILLEQWEADVKPERYQ